jgi:hypothetical protein
MADRETVIATICKAFERTEYPGDAFLLGSTEGCEPLEEVGPFRGRQDWQAIEPDFLDAHAGALSFLSEGGFRYFLPAYLVADLREQLKTADPLFHLTHGFSDIAVQAPTKSRAFLIKSGKSAFVNPRRYGALTFQDSARFRLSVFPREEAVAIVAYLTCKRAHDPDGLDREPIDAALTAFWLERARAAPPAEALRRHIQDQEDYLTAIRKQGGVR